MGGMLPPEPPEPSAITVPPYPFEPHQETPDCPRCKRKWRPTAAGPGEVVLQLSKSSTLKIQCWSEYCPDSCYQRLACIDYNGTRYYCFMCFKCMCWFPSLHNGWGPWEGNSELPDRRFPRCMNCYMEGDQLSRNFAQLQEHSVLKYQGDTATMDGFLRGVLLGSDACVVREENSGGEVQ